MPPHTSAPARFASRLGLVALLLATIAAAPCAHARLGETMSEMKKRLGKAPLPTERKNVYLWYFEVVDGPLAYVVTFNDKNISIAEGLRPMKRARFTPDLAQDFIATQTAPYANSKTLRTVKPGEAYTFAGRNLTCGPKELVTVDDANGILILWDQSAIPSIMAVTPVAMP